MNTCPFILQAVNIYFIPLSENAALCENAKQIYTRIWYYVACLRSTLAIKCCAGERGHCAQSSILQFVPREKALLLVLDHRITNICFAPFNTKYPIDYSFIHGEEVLAGF